MKLYMYKPRVMLTESLLQQIFESTDPRTIGTKGYTGTTDTGVGGMTSAYDWRVWSGSGYGQQVAQGLNNLGKGYEFEVTDFGAWVVIRGGYHNTATGKTSCKTFVVVFDNPKKGDGRIYASSTKWRTISTPNQAVNYAKSVIDSMK